MKNHLYTLVLLSFACISPFTAYGATGAQLLCQKDVNGVVRITQDEIKSILTPANVMGNPLQKIDGSPVFSSSQQVIDFGDHCKVIRGKDARKMIDETSTLIFSRYSSTGLDIEVPENTIAKFSTVSISNVFTGLVKRGKGTLIIDKLIVSNYGGDAVNIRGSNVLIKQYEASGSKPVKPYAILTVTEDIKNNINKLKQVFFNINEYVHQNDLNMLKFIHVGGSQSPKRYKSEAAHVDTGLQAYEEIYINVCDTKDNECVVDNRGHIKTTPTRVVCRDTYLPERIFKKIVLPTKVIYEMAGTLRERNDVDKTQSEIVDDILTSLLDEGFTQNLSKDDPTIIESFDVYVDDVLEIGIDNETYFYEFNTKQFMKQAFDFRLRNDFRRCSVENIVIPSIDVSTKHRLSQVIALTDHHDFNNFQIGTKSLKVASVYREWFKASSLRNSKIGVCNNQQNRGDVLTSCDSMKTVLSCNVRAIESPVSAGIFIDKKLYGNYVIQGKGTTCARNQKPSYAQGIGVSINDGSNPNIEKTCNVHLWGIENKTFDGEKIVMLEKKNSQGKVILRESKKLPGISYVNDRRIEHGKYPSNKPILGCWFP